MNSLRPPGADYVLCIRHASSDSNSVAYRLWGLLTGFENPRLHGSIVVDHLGHPNRGLRSEIQSADTIRLRTIADIELHPGCLNIEK